MVYSKDSFSVREGKPQAASFSGFRRVPEFPTGAAGCEYTVVGEGVRNRKTPKDFYDDCEE